MKHLNYCQLHHVDKCSSFIGSDHAHPIDTGNKVILSVCDLLSSSKNLHVNSWEPFQQSPIHCPKLPRSKIGTIPYSSSQINFLQQNCFYIMTQLQEKVPCFLIMLTRKLISCRKKIS